MTSTRKQFLNTVLSNPANRTNKLKGLMSILLSTFLQTITNKLYKSLNNIHSFIPSFLSHPCTTYTFCSFELPFCFVNSKTYVVLCHLTFKECLFPVPLVQADYYLSSKTILRHHFFADVFPDLLTPKIRLMYSHYSTFMPY